ncbi:MAG: DegV family protein, partial [Anaerolineae bacterium]|nr:DegV family protein [Anaerolineae bacterium]
MTFKKIKFVTDSTCDIPADVARKWGIYVVPTYVNIGEESFADDGVELDREDFFNRLSSITPFPTTAAPSPGVAREVIEDAFEDAEH